MLRQMIGMLLGAIALTGCGKTPMAPWVTPPAPPSQQIGMPTALADGPDQKAIALTFAMVAAVRSLHTASFQAVTYCKGKVGHRPAGLPKLADGTWEATTTTDEVYTAPGNYQVHVAYGGDPTYAGASLDINADAVTVVQPGFWGAFPHRGHLGDASMLDFRGQRRDDLDFAGLARRLGGAATARYVGIFSRGGITLSYVEIPRSPSSDPEVVREVLGIQTITNLPLSIERYTRQGLVFSRKLQALQLDAPPAGADAMKEPEGGEPADVLPGS